MPREAEISVNEREFILKALQENIRRDGRDFDAFRPLDLTFGDEYGVADVQLGKTRCALFLYGRRTISSLASESLPEYQ